MLSVPVLRLGSPFSSAPLPLPASHMRSAGGQRAVTTLERNSFDFIFSSLVMIRMAYLLLPPPPPPRPPPPPPREPPMLDEPRDLTGPSPASAHAAASSAERASVCRARGIRDLLVADAVGPASAIPPMLPRSHPRGWTCRACPHSDQFRG